MPAFALAAAGRVNRLLWVGGLVTFATSSSAASFDHDDDGDIARSDLAELIACWSGPDVDLGSGPCLDAFDDVGNSGPDGDVDLHDFAAFQTLFTGPLLAAHDLTVTGAEGTFTIATLAATYTESPVPVFTYTITALPDAGRLFPRNSTTPIETAPWVVTNPADAVAFLNDTNEFGDAYASFQYTVTDPTTGQTSAPATVTVNITPVNDAPIPGSLETTVDEDAPGFLLQLPEAVDPEGDPVTYSMRNLSFFENVTLYQVAADNETVLDPFPTNFTELVNPDRWFFVELAPDWDQRVFLEYAVSDDKGAISFSGNVIININPVNDAPQVESETVTFVDTSMDPIALIVEVRDEEPAAGHWTVTITNFPDHGRLYHTTVTPENELTPTAPDVATSGPVCRSQATFCTGALQLYYVPDQPIGTGEPYDEIVYSVSDGALSSAASFTLNALPGQLPPELTSPTDLFTTVDTPIEFTLSATDPNGDAIFLQSVNLPDNGTLEVFDTIDAFWFPLFAGAEIGLDAEGELLMRYTPNPGYSNDGGAPDVFNFRLLDYLAPVPPVQSLKFHVAAAS